MKKRFNLAAMLAPTLMLAAYAGNAATEGAPPAPQPADVQAQADYRALMERAFAKQDVNADGFLSNGVLFQEVTPEQLAAMDIDSDGRVTKAEYMAHAMKGREG
ncbi:hypothetical protein [Achromobacter sp. Bel]|uniref:hypothetical protein n=1 Tax=Achromobacter sp. Bel TaxID=2727415 RepID=UPI00145F37C1|nr:hypothetical protein [Achromobacter sp. Bel]NMK45151.1 hypothetical protein [Achromobacter sp. Bel]